MQTLFNKESMILTEQQAFLQAQIADIDLDKVTLNQHLLTVESRLD